MRRGPTPAAGERRERKLAETKRVPFFARRYAEIEARTKVLGCAGSTNFGPPLERAAGEFRRIRTWPGRHALFLTDGVPTAGDRAVERELRSLHLAGVRVHAVFFGEPVAFPHALARIAALTRGRAFCVSPEGGSTLAPDGAAEKDRPYAVVRRHGNPRANEPDQAGGI